MERYEQACKAIQEYLEVQNWTDSSQEMLTDYYSNMFDFYDNNDELKREKLTIVFEEVVKLPKKINDLIDLLQIQQSGGLSLQVFGYKHDRLTDKDCKTACKSIEIIAYAIEKFVVDKEVK